MSNTNLHIEFIPGSFSPPNFYFPVIERLLYNPFFKPGSIGEVALPSVGRREGQPPATMAEDAQLVHEVLHKLVDQGKDVIVIGHSYGGVPMTEGTKGLSKEERKRQGKSGGVVRLGYMTAFAPLVGRSLVTSAPPAEGADDRTTLGEDGYLVANVKNLAPICMNDVPLEEAEKLVSQFRPHSAVSFIGEVTYAGYKDIPASYLLCEDDLIILPEVQRMQIDNIEKERGERIEVTSIKTGHCPNVSAPEKVVDWILRLVEQSRG